MERQTRRSLRSPQSVVNYTPSKSTSSQSQTTPAIPLTTDPKIVQARRRLIRYKRKHLKQFQARYHSNLLELCFLQSGSFLLNFYDHRRKTTNPAVSDVLRTGALDEDDMRDVTRYLGQTSAGTSHAADFFPPMPDNIADTDVAATLGEVGLDPSASLPRGLGLSLTSSSTHHQINLSPGSDDEVDNFLDDEAEISRRALKEADVMGRVAELRQTNLWSESVTAMPVLDQPNKPAYFMDNFFAEMQWLSEDFVREKHYKKTCARKLALAAVKCLKDREERSKKIAREEFLRTRKLAATVSKMIRDWWRQMDRIVKAKHDVRLASKRQQAMNTHLGKVIETTEKYTEWLTEGLKAAAADVRSDTEAENGLASQQEDGDSEFEPPVDLMEAEEDDEETIDREEAELGEDVLGEEERLEAEELQKESEIPIEDLVKLWEQMRQAEEEEKQKKESNEKTSSLDSEEKMELDDKEDRDFHAESDGEDDEATVAEQEQHEDAKELETYKLEVNQLEEEANLPMEELMKRYNWTSEEAGDVASLVEDEESEDSGSSGEESDEEEESEKETSASEASDEESESEFGLKDLFILDQSHKKTDDVAPEPVPSDPDTVTPAATVPAEEQKEITFQGEDEFNALTLEALSAQPRGFTLESTAVNIKVPFLLKGNLREYQFVGLDWLAAIYEKRLNGILADEMGLGKTIQTIALLAHMACEKGVWGPHLIVVPTSVLLNWEMELKRWCPAFKIITYYGSLKERKDKRKGWSKTNAFHVCITSYKLAIQDQLVFKRKKWKYLILDEAQNIKNFKSQRWQTLLTFNSQRRLLLTGTPLQNTLMELWSLMHFLMPHIFQSHREFQEWFASPLTGMIEGNSEYNEQLVQRLHKVLRPFILRRLKKDVEKQMPQKYEHVVMCRLSRRQRFLYDDFMSRTGTRETLASGQFLSVINILMQLRKVCNHPDLLEPRPILSSFHMDALVLSLPRLILSVFVQDPLCHVDPLDLIEGTAQRRSLVDMAVDLPGFVAREVRRLAPKPGLIQEIDSVFPKISTLDEQRDLPDLSRTFLPRGVTLELQDEYTKKINASLDPMDSPSKTRLPLSYNPLTTNYATRREFEYDPIQPPNAELPAPLLALRQAARQSRLQLMARVNQRRTTLDPLYTSDLIYHVSALFMAPSKDSLSTVSTANLSRKSQANQRLSLQLIKPQDQQVVSESSDGAMFSARDVFLSSGYVNCLRAQLGHQYCHPARRIRCSTLENIILNPERRLHSMGDVISRFILTVPPATAPPLDVHVSLASFHSSCESREMALTRLVPLKSTRLLHAVTGRQLVQFPDSRLIQYDCGKLQRLQSLLRDLKSGSHRVLIFTQMTRMLDILEAFLSYHGHRYLRLDGTTKVEQRQTLMELFNQDPRIFVFILSTRSGGLGVNLTGADTVIFYDSDWNPTMDAQAQDRCHRIGQTRDVHIYRLISEKTVEENILKKANQKRFLADVAIEGGQFTTAFFKKNTIAELFEEPSGLQELAREKNSEAVQPEPVDVPVSTPADMPPPPREVLGADMPPPPPEEVPGEVESSDLESSSGLAEDVPSQDARPRRKRKGTKGESSSGGDMSETALENALEQFEDENDRVATSKAKAEAQAELAEFDETIPWDETEAGRAAAARAIAAARSNTAPAEGESGTEDMAERELREFDRQLRPIERFGVNCLESIWGPSLIGQLELADVALEQSKVSWELEQLKALREEEELRAEVEDDEMLYCYGDYDPTAAQRRELERVKAEERVAEAEAEAEETRRKEEVRRRRELMEQQRRRHWMAVTAQKKVKCAANRISHKRKRDVPQIAPARFEIPNQNADLDPDSQGNTDSASPSPTKKVARRKTNPALAARYHPQHRRFDPEDDELAGLVDIMSPDGTITSPDNPINHINHHANRLSAPLPASSYSQHQALRMLLNRPRGAVAPGDPGRERLSGRMPIPRLSRPHPLPQTTQRTPPKPKQKTVPTNNQPSMQLISDPVHLQTIGNRLPIPRQFLPYPPTPTPTPHQMQYPLSPYPSSPNSQQRLILPQPISASPRLPSFAPRGPQLSPNQRAVRPNINSIPVSTQSGFIQAQPQHYQRPQMMEPHFTIQSTNGYRSFMPTTQFIYNSQPILVITRQTKTPSGDIVEQRFTQPIQPTTQYLQMVNRVRCQTTSMMPQNPQQQQILTPRFVSQPSPVPLRPVSAPQTAYQASSVSQAPLIRPRQLTNFSVAQIVRTVSSTVSPAPVIMRPQQQLTTSASNSGSLVTVVSNQNVAPQQTLVLNMGSTVPIVPKQVSIQPQLVQQPK